MGLKRETLMGSDPNTSIFRLRTESISARSQKLISDPKNKGGCKVDPIGSLSHDHP